MPGQSPEIANEFIRLAEDRGKKPFTQMQLQKLVYIAHGWSLALTDEPLTKDLPQAWQYGPVYTDLREALRKYGKEPVKQPIKANDYGYGKYIEPENDDVACALLTSLDKGIINKIFEEYGNYPAFKLSALTHQEGTSWSRVYEVDGNQYGEISNSLIKGHFLDLKRQTAA